VPTASDTSLGSSGESCTRAADCASGLKCIAQVCIDPKRGSEGDECEASKDCNAHLRCAEQKCARRDAGASAKPAPAKRSSADEPSGDSSPSPDAAPTQPKTAPNPLAASFGGFSATVGFGYGTGADKGGLAYGTSLSYRFSSYVGVTGIAITSGASVGAIAVGLHLGRVVVFRPMIGSIAQGPGSSGFGALGALGVNIGLSDSWALTPELAIGKAFSADGAMLVLGIGLTYRIPRVGE
jgi:hypothetical protein